MSVAMVMKPKAKTPPFITGKFKAAKTTKPDPLQSIAKAAEGEIVNRYDYTKVNDEGIRATLQDLEVRIRKSIRQERTACLEIGKALLEAKSLNQWGDFENWVAKSFPDFSKRTSDHYMALARAFGETFDLVSYLPAQTLYMLAEGKNLKEVRSEVIEKAKGGNCLSKGDIQARIAQIKMASAEGKRAPKARPLHDDKGRTAAANDAVALLLEKLDNDFAKFVELFKGAEKAFMVALDDAARKMAVRSSNDA